VGKLVVVASEAAVADVEARATREAIERVLDEGTGELNGAVLPEVEVDHGIGGLDGGEGSAVRAGDERRLDEFVALGGCLLVAGAAIARGQCPVGACVRLLDGGARRR